MVEDVRFTKSSCETLASNFVIKIRRHRKIGITFITIPGFGSFYIFCKVCLLILSGLIIGVLVVIVYSRGRETPGGKLMMDHRPSSMVAQQDRTSRRKSVTRMTLDLISEYESTVMGDHRVEELESSLEM